MAKQGRIDPYLYFKGNCLEAMTFYSQVFGSPLSNLMYYRDVPGTPEDPHLRDLVMHVGLALDNCDLMASDDLEESALPTSQVGLTWSTDSETRAREVWTAFTEAGSKVEMPLEPAFFAKLFGSLVDPFGITWQVFFGEMTPQE